MEEEGHNPLVLIQIFLELVLTLGKRDKAIWHFYLTFVVHLARLFANETYSKVWFTIN